MASVATLGAGALLAPALYAFSGTTSTDMHAFSGGGHGRHAGPRGGGEMGLMGEFGGAGIGEDILNPVTHTTANVTNGVQETLTTTDSGTLAGLLSRADRASSITQTAVKSASGAVFTITSTNADVVARLQDRVDASIAREKVVREKITASGATNTNHNRGGFKMIAPALVKVDGGIQITITVNNDRALKAVQAQVDRENSIKTTYTKLANGIQITKTSTDASIVTQLQSMSKPAREKEGDHGMMGKMQGKGRMGDDGKTLPAVNE